MIILKIIYGLIGANAIAFLVLLFLYMGYAQSKHVDRLEKGWMNLFAIIGLLDIAFSILPILSVQSSTRIMIALFFAALPLVIWSTWFINKRMKYYKEKRRAHFNNNA